MAHKLTWYNLCNGNCWLSQGTIDSMVHKANRRVHSTTSRRGGALANHAGRASSDNGRRRWTETEALFQGFASLQHEKLWARTVQCSSSVIATHINTPREYPQAGARAFPTIDHPRSLAWKAIQFIADWQPRQGGCVFFVLFFSFQFSKWKLVRWTKDGTAINPVYRGFTELPPPRFLLFFF